MSARRATLPRSASETGRRARYGARSAALLVAGALLLGAGSMERARATSVRSLNITQLAELAALVVEGRIQRCRSQATELAPGLFTLCTLRAHQLYKGELPGDGEVTLALAGGRDGARRVEVDGMPRFAPGDRVLLFLEPLRPLAAFSPPGRLPYLPLGLGQGVLRVERLEGREIFRRDEPGAGLLLLGPALDPGPFEATSLRARVRASCGRRL